MVSQPLTLPARDVANLRDYLVRADAHLANGDQGRYHAVLSEMAGYLAAALDAAEQEQHG